MAKDQRTKAQLLEENARLNECNTVHALALASIVNGEIEATESGEYDGGRYVFRLMRAAAPHGGILTATFQCPGQKDWTAAYYLDKMRADIRQGYAFRDAPECLAALDRIFLAARKIQDTAFPMPT